MGFFSHRSDPSLDSGENAGKVEKGREKVGSYRGNWGAACCLTLPLPPEDLSAGVRCPRYYYLTRRVRTILQKSQKNTRAQTFQARIRQSLPSGKKKKEGGSEDSGEKKKRKETRRAYRKPFYYLYSVDEQQSRYGWGEFAEGVEENAQEEAPTGMGSGSFRKKRKKEKEEGGRSKRSGSRDWRARCQSIITSGAFKPCWKRRAKWKGQW